MKHDKVILEILIFLRFGIEKLSKVDVSNLYGKNKTLKNEKFKTKFDFISNDF